MENHVRLYDIAKYFALLYDIKVKVYVLLCKFAHTRRENL